MTEGRLNQATLNLLEGADIQFRRENRLDIALVKNLPMALVFLPAADIPTFVGEGRVDLGITGWDQVQEHDAGVREYNRTRRSSISRGSSSTSVNGVVVSAEDPPKTAGSVKRLDLEFGFCKLQVQVPEMGRYATTKDLVGKTIGTSFVHLAAEYFAKLELEMEGKVLDDDAEVLTPRKLRTKIIELSGSVEAACALGVADGIVDLVGKGELFFFFLVEGTSLFGSLESVLILDRIWRDHEGGRPDGHRHRGGIAGRAHQVAEPVQRRAGRDYCPAYRGQDCGGAECFVPVQHPADHAGGGHQNHPRDAGPDDYDPGRRRVGCRQRHGGEEEDCHCNGRPVQCWCAGYPGAGHS